MPGVAAFPLGNRNVPQKLDRAIRRVGPGDAVQHVLHDLPVGKMLLNLLRIGNLQRAQDQAFRCSLVGHGEMIATRNQPIRDNRGVGE
jgi:hypothetical protein